MKSRILLLVLSIALFANINAQVVVQQQTVTTTFQNQVPGFQMNFNAWDPMISTQTQYSNIWDPSRGEYILVPMNTSITPTYSSYYDQFGNLVQQQQQTVYVDQFGNPIQQQQQQQVVYVDQYGNPIQTQSNYNCNTAAPINYNVYPQQTSVNPINTVMPMNPASFSQALAQIKQQNFESTRLTVSKQIITSNFFTSDQVRQMMQQMSFESSRVELARFAYNRVLDQQNYYLVNNAFSFSSSVDELNSYLFGR
jgi:hypothetical protein